MQGLMPMTEELRKKQIREEKIVEGIITTVGGVVALTIIVGAPVIITITIGKLALRELKDKISQNLCDK
jgi:hypothetical protein